MEIRSRDRAAPFVTNDGSTIRSLLDLSTAPVRNQSLAEATLAAGQATRRHYHAESEEIYYITEGAGEMEVNGEFARVARGDAILIPPGAWHQLRAAPAGPVRLLCACSPPWRAEDTFFQ
jgi:mannose-6-phosphate isomerase-like protein (cupin superfamily)